jgi:hypothetical protein
MLIPEINCTGILCSLMSRVIWISDNRILDSCAEDDLAVSLIFNGTINETSLRDKGLEAGTCEGGGKVDVFKEGG